MASVAFNRGLMLRGSSLNWETDDIRCLLLKSGTPVQTWDYVSDCTPGTNEISVGNYARVALTGKVVVQDSIGCDFKANKITFVNLGGGQTITWALLYLYNASDAAATLLYGLDVADMATNGVNMEVRLDGVDGVGKAAESV